MHFSITSVAVLAVTLLGIASAQTNTTDSYGICTCFRPKYDASCCMLVRGYMMKDGNVCNTPDGEKSVDDFESCCNRVGGRYKCKHGERDPAHWPPEDTFSCNS